MLDCEYHNFPIIDVIKDYEAAGPKADRPFAKFWRHVLDRSPGERMLCQELNALADRADCPACRILILGRKEAMKAVEVP